MIWVGFGFLMTFLKRYGQSATGLTFLFAAVLVQAALICNGVTDTLATGAKAYLSLERSVSSILCLLLRVLRNLANYEAQDACELRFLRELVLTVSIFA